MAVNPGLFGGPTSVSALFGENADGAEAVPPGLSAQCMANEKGFNRREAIGIFGKSGGLGLHAAARGGTPLQSALNRGGRGRRVGTKFSTRWKIFFHCVEKSRKSFPLRGKNRPIFP